MKECEKSRDLGEQLKNERLLREEKESIIKTKDEEISKLRG